MSQTDRPPSQTDFAVVGGGIVGLAAARELSIRHPDASICVLEAEDRLAAHQTSHSSGVIHRGVYYEPGSLRARLCVEGAAELVDYCNLKSIPVIRNGKLIVASNETEVTRLDELEKRALANGVPGLRRIGDNEINGIEPAARGLSALHSPDTATVDFSRVARGFAADIEEAEGSIHTGAGVLAAEETANGLALTTASGRLQASQVIFCAGLQADRLARLCGGSRDPRIVPIRGGYLKVRAGREDLVKGNLYPVPDPELPFLGAHLTRRFDGILLIGPTAMLVAARDAYRPTRLRGRDLLETMTWPGTWRLLTRHAGTAAREVRNSFRPRSLVEEAQRLVPDLGRDDVEPGPAGIRAQALGRDGRLIEDFLIEKTESAIHVRNAPSPAATSSMALARLIVDRV